MDIPNVVTVSGEEVSVVWAKHLLLNGSPGSEEMAILRTRDESGEDTSSVIVIMKSTNTLPLRIGIGMFGQCT